MKAALLAGALIFATITSAQAKGTPNVEFTVHNLSATMGGFENQGLAPSPYVAYGDPGGREEQICIFCHTPHGGDMTGPLWNHSLPGASAFTHYNSTSLSTTLRNLSSTRAVNDESLLCMSCHDGSIAVNRVLNPGTGGQPRTSSGDASIINSWNPISGATIPGPRIGDSLAEIAGSGDGNGDLTDDHPISFSYYDVYNDPTETELHSVAEAETAGVRFFPINGPEAAAGKRVECSSCHDPHVDNYNPDFDQNGHVPASPEYRPFLITPNTGSALCLACHIK
jgi:hypothetical protein